MGASSKMAMYWQKIDKRKLAHSNKVTLRNLIILWATLFQCYNSFGQNNLEMKDIPKGNIEAPNYGGILQDLFHNGIESNLLIAIRSLDSKTSSSINIENGSLTLSQAVFLSLYSNKELKAKQMSVISSRWQAQGANAKLNPRLSVQYARGFEHSGASGEAFTNAPIELPDHIRNDNSIILEQPILDLSLLKDIHQQESLADAAIDRCDDGIVSLAMDVAISFDQQVQYKLLSKLAEVNMNHNSSLKKYMQLRVEGGGASKVDLSQIQSDALVAERNEKEASSLLENARNKFYRLTGSKPDLLFLEPAKIIQIPESNEIAYEILTTRSPNFSAMRKDIEAANSAYQSSMNQKYPRVVLDVGRYSSHNDSGVNGSTLDRRAMVVMTMNGFDGGVATAIGQAQLAQKQQLEFKYEDALQQSRERLENNYQNLSFISSLLTNSRSEIEANTKVADAFVTQFEAGQRSFTDVRVTFEKLYQSWVNYVKLLFSYRQARYQIAKELGVLDLLSLTSTCKKSN